MTSVDIALIVTTAFFAIYSLFAAIELVISLSLLWPKLISSQPKQTIRHLFTPTWEITNVFLVFGFTVLAVLFNQALSQLSRSLLGVLLPAVIALPFRAASVIYLYYAAKDGAVWQQPAQWLFMITSAVVPLSFGAAGIYLLTGSNFWQSPLGWSLLVAEGLGLLAVGFCLVGYRLKLNRYLLLVWSLALGVWFPLQANHANQQLLGLSVMLLLGLIILALVLTFVAYGRTFEKLLLAWAAGLISLFTPLGLAWSNRPYLINGRLLLHDAYGAQAYLSIFVIGLIVILPLLVIGFYLFLKLLRTAKPRLS